MVDTLTQEKRSWNMSRIRSGNTKPEIAVRQVLYGMGYRFRLHNPNLPGKPDIILPKYKTVIFVHGCFWHRHRGCKYAYNPKSRVEFWNKKFEANVKRDKAVAKDLAKMGWREIVLWECRIKNKDQIAKKLKNLFGETDG